MRIICIFTRSWAWQGVEKLKCRTAFFCILGEGVANALTPPVLIFLMSAGKNFFNFPQQHYNIFQQIFHIITPSKSQYKKRGKIIIHHSPKNVKRGGGNRKNGGLQGWLEMSIPPLRNIRSFSGSLYIYNALLSAFDKVPFSQFPLVLVYLQQQSI